MAKLQDLKYDGDYVFSEDARRFYAECNERSVYSWPIIKAAERLTDDELYWIYIEAVGAFECSDPSYEPPPKELISKAGPIVHFFVGYGAALCDIGDQ